eukprot:EG_transcript_773
MEEDLGFGKGHVHPEFDKYHRQWEAEQCRLRDLVVDSDAEPWALDGNDKEGKVPLRYVAGLDISFVKEDPNTACAAIVVVDFPALELQYEAYHMVTLELPYISGFLAFRECPHLVSLVNELRTNRPDLVPQILMVDGMGVLHPRGLGLASHLGVLTGLPTIGVGKTFLNVDGLRKDAVLQESRRHLPAAGSAWTLQGESGRILGAAFRSTDDAPNPVFVSRGHLITLATTLEVVRRCCKFRVPEPIRLADKGSREYLRLHHRPATETSGPSPTDEPHAATAMHLHADRWVVALQRTATERAEPASVAIHFCLDNSGSMAGSSRTCLDCFSELVALATEPCTLTVFSDAAQTLSTSLRIPAEVTAVQLPAQGMTNITAGVGAMLQAVAAAAQAKPHTHHILILLTDGDHNSGEKPAAALPRLAAQFHAQVPQVKVSFLVIGVTAQSRTDLGMLVKTALETVPLPNLRSIYFCVQAQEMQDTLSELKTGLLSTAGGKVVRVGCPAVAFYPSLSAAPAPECDLYVTGALSKPGAACFVQAQGPSFEGLRLDGISTPVRMVEFDEEVAMQAVEALLQQLRQRKVAAGDVRAELAALEPWVRALERKLGGEHSGVDLAHLTPQQRVQLHKQLTRGLHKVRQLRNEVAAIAAMAANSSAAQAEFLTGATGKYAAKAYARGDPTAHTVDAILQDLRDRRPKLERALMRDALLWLRRVRDVPALLAEAADRAHLLQEALQVDPANVDALNPDLVSFLRHDLPPLLRRAAPVPESYLSLQTQWEHIVDWAAADPEEVRGEVDGEYELLMYLGLLGFPIAVHRCNASQMDPFQCRVSALLPAPCDSASLFVALKSGVDVKSPEGPLVEDLLVTIDPHFPHTSAVVYWSRLADTLYSVALCRDLFMYSGPAQRIALHAHAFCAAVDQAQHEVFTARALQILYSVRRHWGPQGGEPYRALAARLLRWEPVTEADGVSHPVELLLALAALDWGDGPALPPPALMVLFNETLSRRARAMLRGMTTDHSDASTLRQACRLMRRALGITDDSCPEPTPPEEKEAPLEVTRDACRCDYTVTPAEVDLAAFLEETLRPTVRVLRFVRALHAVLAGRGGWPGLMAALEADAAGEVISHLAAACRAEEPGSALELLGETDPRRREATGVAMGLQAFLHHVSARRQQLGDPDDGATLRDLVKDLRMDVYLTRLQAKNAARQAIIGSLTFDRAMDADEDEFDHLVGAHAHGLSRREFWALARVAKRLAGRKRELFLQKCNQPFPAGKQFGKL